MSSFERKNMQILCNSLRYRIDLYFHGYKYAMEIEEKGHINKDLNYEM